MGEGEGEGEGGRGGCYGMILMIYGYVGQSLGCVRIGLYFYVMSLLLFYGVRVITGIMDLFFVVNSYIFSPMYFDYVYYIIINQVIVILKLCFLTDLLIYKQILLGVFMKIR